MSMSDRAPGLHPGPDIFLSYRRTDKEFVAKLVSALEGLGPSVWWDADIEGGDDWRDSIVENLPTMLFVKDASDLRFRRINRAAEDVLGLDRRALLGKTDYDLFPAAQADAFTAKDRVVLRGPASWSLLSVESCYHEQPLS